MKKDVNMILLEDIDIEHHRTEDHVNDVKMLDLSSNNKADYLKVLRPSAKPRS